MTNLYKKAYTEVLEILKFLPESDYNKIPIYVIDFFEKNKDNEHYFKYYRNKTLEEQGVLRETNLIIVSLYNDYFATKNQKQKFKDFFALNEQSYQENLRNKYNPDNIFKKNTCNCNFSTPNESKLIEYPKPKWYQTFFSKILKIFRKK